jgi:ribosomal protein L7/L12
LAIEEPSEDRDTAVNQNYSGQASQAIEAQKTNLGGCMIKLQITEQSQTIIVNALRVADAEFRQAADKMINTYASGLIREHAEKCQMLADQIEKLRDDTNIAAEIRRVLKQNLGIIPAIKRHRELTNDSLYDAKTYVERLRDQMQAAGELSV